MNQDKKISEFLYKFEAYARLSDRRFRRHRSVKNFSYADLGTAMDHLSTMSWEEEPYIELTIPQDRFRLLVEMDEYNTKREEEYDWVRKEQERQRHELWVRQKNPAVQKAWERYQLLLGLADEGQ